MDSNNLDPILWKLGKIEEKEVEKNPLSASGIFQGKVSHIENLSQIENLERLDSTVPPSAVLTSVVTSPPFPILLVPIPADVEYPIPAVAPPTLPIPTKSP